MKARFAEEIKRRIRMIIDAHAHLWDPQAGRVNGKPVVPFTGGKSDFGGEQRQMMPPYMLDEADR